MKQVDCRIDGVVATEANIAVVFRRGPSKFTRMLVWDLNTDVVTGGQWLKGRVYTRRCDVSPDGKHVVIAATNYGKKRAERDALEELAPYEVSGWTAVSRPPYFTAVALWFMGGAWNGGGIWESNTELRVNNFQHIWREQFAPPKLVKVSNLNIGPSEDEPVFTWRLQRHGWIGQKPVHPGSLITSYGKLPGVSQTVLDKIQDSMPKWRKDTHGILIKPFRGGFLRREGWRGRERLSVHDSTGLVHRIWLPHWQQSSWLDVDANGRIIFAENGCLWAWKGLPNGKPKMIADLNDQKFEAIEAPDWACKW